MQTYFQFYTCDYKYDFYPRHNEVDLSVCHESVPPPAGGAGGARLLPGLLHLGGSGQGAVGGESGVILARITSITQHRLGKQRMGKNTKTTRRRDSA